MLGLREVTECPVLDKRWEVALPMTAVFPEKRNFDEYHLVNVDVFRAKRSIIQLP